MNVEKGLYEFLLTQCFQSFYFADFSHQDHAIGVSFVLGMLALLCITMFFVVVRHRLKLNRKNGSSDDV